MISTGHLIINGTEVDLGGGVPFPLNFSIADVKEPEKRKRNFSRGLTLPGTQKNMNFFSSTYDLSLTSLDNTTLVGFDFDPTVRAEARYYKKGTIVFDGLIQVNNVEIKEGVHSFNCTLYSDFVDLYMTLKDILVSELGWSEYDHALTRTIIKNSWDTSVLLNATPVSNFTAGNPDGFGYLYPLVNYGYTLQTPGTYKTSDIVPHIYVREVVEKCLTLAGYTYSSDWLDSTLIKKLIFGFGGGEKFSLSALEVAQRQTQFHGDWSSLTTKTYSSSIFVPAITPFTSFYRLTFPVFDSFNLIQNSNFTDVIDQDTLTQYDAATGEVTVSLSGRYRIDLAGVLDLTLVTGSMTLINNGGAKGIRIIKNGILIPNGIVNFSTFASTNIALTVELDLVAGDVIAVEMFFGGNVVTQVDNLIDSEPITLTIADTTDVSFNMTAIETSVSDGSTINISRYIPKMKASDFLSAIIKMGNLMLSDPDIDGVITIEPLEDFYQSTNNFDDITDLIDHDEPILINPPSSLIQGRFYNFLWAADNDYDNKRYRDTYGIGYGDKVYEVESTFQTGDRDYKLPFAQSVPVDIINTTLVVPRIISYDDNTNVTKPFKGKPRIYFYNGLKTEGWRLTNTDDVSLFDSLSSYPCVHHLDDFETPTFDLNFGIPSILYYAASAYTTDNLFSRYHLRFVKELTGRDSKLIELYVKTNADMINKLDFSLLKMINGVLFRLNEITDFDSDVTESTKYELIKILEANSPKKKSLPTGPIKNPRNTAVLSGGSHSPNDDVHILGGGKKSSSISSAINSNS